MRLIPKHKPVQFVLDESLAPGQIVHGWSKDREPYKFTMSSATLSQNWEYLRAMREEIEFYVREFGVAPVTGERIAPESEEHAA